MRREFTLQLIERPPACLSTWRPYIDNFPLVYCTRSPDHNGNHQSPRDWFPQPTWFFWLDDDEAESMGWTV